MNLICNPRNIFNRIRPVARMKDIMAAGFEMSMLDMRAWSDEREFENIHRNNFKREPNVVYLTEHPEQLCEEADRLTVKPAGELGLKLPIAMAPYAAADTMLGKEPEKRAKELNEIYRQLGLETIKAAVAAGCERVVVHPLFAGIAPKDEWVINQDFYRELARQAESLGSSIRILLLNSAKDINGHFVRGICAEPEEACSRVDELNKEFPGRFAFCFDIGTATLCGQNLYEAIVPLGERLEAVIIRDCDAVHDVAMLPYTACIKGQQTGWLELIRAVRKVGFDGDLIMDFSDTYIQMPDRLRQSVLRLGHELGEFLFWQLNIENVVKKYDKRVLFGAGNMCRAYMKNYGKEYPPLFTCDNNSARRGEEFCGLTIESPEKLRELSPDTAIFICNIYYNEITEQLREMKLPNPIEWFNDEYMPTFHMDRLDMAADPNAGKGAKA